MPRINASVIIPTYNRADVLPICLRSLFEQTADPTCYEILLVDDGCTDATPAVMKELQKVAPCRLVYLRQEHAGRARACNTGIRASRGSLVIILDSDMIVTPEFVSAHLSAHDEPDLIIRGPVINTTDFVNPTSAPAKLTDISRAFFSANASVTREKIFAAGLFDEEFVEYGWEDLELGFRLRKLGLKLRHSSAAACYHLQHGLTGDGLPGLIKRERERGHTAVLFLRKHPAFRVRMMTSISPVLFTLDRLIAPFHWPERRGVLNFARRLDTPTLRPLFLLMAFIVRNHAYADGLREGFASQRLKEADGR